MRFAFTKPAVALVAVLVAAALVTTRSIGLSDANTREGCMDQWLFNGVWRVQVTNVAPLLDGGQFVGWQVTEVWRNGTSVEVAPGDTLLKDQQLELPSGSVLASSSSWGTLSMSNVAAHNFPASGQYTYTQNFRGSGMAAASKPKAIDIIFDGAKLPEFKTRPQFTTSQYNFRFKLDCQATGQQAQAEGGSGQVAGAEGCLNQWMSNGVWKMRATAIGIDDNNDPSSGQIGWMITQDWVNLTARPLAPGDVWMTDQQLVLASGNTVSSTNTTGTSMNFGQLGNRTFPPGGAFTYQQRFRYGPFNADDKPVRLLVTFDAAKENARDNAPHYKLPANFRISFSCTK